MTGDRPATCAEFLRARGFSRHLLTYLRHHDNTLLLNSEAVFTNHPLHKGDVMEVIFTDEIPSETIVPNPMDLDILYEDEDLLVINKPPFLPVQPSIGHFEYTLGNGVAAYYAAQSIPFVYRCVNRLDRNTSGLVIISKNMASSAILYDEMKNRRIRRTYLAVVHGRIDAPGTVDAPIRRRTASLIERCVDPENGQRAVTHYTPLSYHEELDTTALMVRLETGRTHQIRVHMASIGHALVADTLYGHRSEDLISRQALHSLRLEFTHPITRVPLQFEAPVPADIRSLLVDESDIHEADDPSWSTCSASGDPQAQQQSCTPPPLRPAAQSGDHAGP